ncbi:MAG: hypothetical protein WC466_05400 [Candidatus Izemoplasmatales bacterium]
MEKIKQISEFSKMFKINIPVESYFDYYIKVLSESFEYKNIYNLVERFSEFEMWVEANGYQNVAHYKMEYAFKELINYISSTNAYKGVLDFDYSKIGFFKKDNWKLYQNNFFLSVDIASANFQSLKLFDKENQMKSSWAELLNHLSVYPLVAESKSFRQLVFGNLNPKRIQKIQHYQILKIFETLEDLISTDEIVVVSEDEIVFCIGNNESDALEKRKNLLLEIEKIREVHLSKKEGWMETKNTTFKYEKTSKDLYTKTIFLGNTIDITNSHKTLYGCPGNVFYLNFKKYILDKPVEEKDCFFQVDNKLAKWVNW